MWWIMSGQCEFGTTSKKSRFTDYISPHEAPLKALATQPATLFVVKLHRDQVFS